MNAKLAKALTTVAITFLSLPCTTRADDAALKEQLLGSWRGPGGEKIELKEKGVVTESDRDEPGTWKVENGVLLIEFHRQDSFKILSVTATKLEIQDMYHGRHKGTWTRLSKPPKFKAGNNSSAVDADGPNTNSAQEKLIRNFYATYFQPRFWDNRKTMSKFLTQPLVNGMLKASQQDLDLGNPVVPGNDYDEKEVLRTLHVEPAFRDSVDEFRVTLTNLGKDYTATYHLRKENGQWRIADIVAENRSYLQRLPR